MSTEPQIKKIHALKRDLSIDDTTYREMLGAYPTDDGKQVHSSAGLSREQASDLIERLEHTVDETPALRDRIYATPKQHRLIAALWRKVSRARDNESRRQALDTFLRRRFHVRRSNHIPRKTADGVIKSLRKMAENA